MGVWVCFQLGANTRSVYNIVRVPACLLRAFCVFVISLMSSIWNLELMLPSLGATPRKFVLVGLGSPAYAILDNNVLIV